MIADDVGSSARRETFVFLKPIELHDPPPFVLR
jgi:hypothetical protein